MIWFQIAEPAAIHRGKAVSPGVRFGRPEVRPTESASDGPGACVLSGYAGIFCLPPAWKNCSEDLQMWKEVSLSNFKQSASVAELMDFVKNDNRAFTATVE